MDETNFLIHYTPKKPFVILLACDASPYGLVVVSSHQMYAKAPIHPWEKTAAPWVRIHIDFAGPFLGKMFLIIYDSYLKWVDAIPVTNISSPTEIDRLRCSFSIHGIPYFIVSDNGTPLASVKSSILSVY